MSHSAQTWNAGEYAAHGRFVADLASPVVSLLHPQPGERILDAGCGDGALTAVLAQAGCDVLGVDSSAAMVAAAQARASQSPASQSSPAFRVEQHDLLSLPFAGDFDAVFSNAALHWLPAEHQPAMLATLFRALRTGGRLVAEMGGQGNIASIRAALSLNCAPYGLDAEAKAASFYPSAAHYRQLLQGAGFQVNTIELIPRLTPLPGGADGMTIWLNTFRNGILDLLPAERRDEVLRRTVEVLRPILSDPAADGAWTADYVRLRFQAVRPG